MNGRFKRSETIESKSTNISSTIYTFYGWGSCSLVLYLESISVTHFNIVVYLYVYPSVININKNSLFRYIQLMMYVVFIICHIRH